MKKVSIKRLSYSDTALVDDIHVDCSQSMFVSSPVQVMKTLSEVGSKNINIPYSIKLANETIGFFTLNYFCNIAVQADPVYFGGEQDCRVESFMIDKRYQGKGYGKAAINEIIKLLHKEQLHIKGIKLSVNFLNKGAKLFYAKCGFKDTGSVYDGGLAGPQHIYRLDL